MISESFQYKTERLLLRFPEESDIETTFSATRYKGFNDGMLWEKPESVEPLYEHHRSAVRAWRNNEFYAFSVDLIEPASFLGRIGVHPAKSKDTQNAGIKYIEPGSALEIGFWMHPEHQGNGYMTEAVEAVLKICFNTLKAEKIEAFHACWNKASESVLRNNGFEFVEYIEQGFKKHGQWVDENKLSINREQFEKLKRKKQ